MIIAQNINYSCCCNNSNSTSFRSSLSPVTNSSIKSFGFSYSVFPTLKSFCRNPNYSLINAKNRRRGGAVVIRAAASGGSDYYSVLNVSKNATLPEIKSSYRKLARKVLFSLYLYLSGASNI